jgi:hypothetical protein
MPVGFRDLEFDRRFARVPQSDGAPAWKWVRVGMPRIGDNMRACVFFLFGQDAGTGRAAGPGGTGFFVRVWSRRREGLTHIYAVSNRHVVQNFHDIRVNTHDGAARMIEIEPGDWSYSSTADLAATDVTEHFLLTRERPQTDIVAAFVDHGDLLGQRHADHHVAMGDDTIMVGLFADHPGGGRNVPVARFGNVAAMPDPAAPVALSEVDALAGPAFLNDLRSRSGFSGSPVWAWRTPYNDTSAPDHDARREAGLSRDRASLHLIGVHRGQMREEIVATRPGGAVETLVVPSAMTVVIPAWEVAALLSGQEFERQRAAREQRPDVVALYRALQRQRLSEEGP